MPPDNPRYVALKTELDSARSNLKAEQANLKSLQNKLAEYQSRLFNTPEVERDYKTLTRDYQNNLSKYQELKNKQIEAHLAQALESGSNAERWKLVEPAFLPKLPDSPNRLGIALLGFLMAFGAGLGGVGVAEYSDTTVRGSRMVAVTVGRPPLAVIPDMGPARA